MDRKTVTVDPYDPYEYVIYNTLDEDKSNLKHKLTFHRLCCLLRRYDNVDGYTIEYWNKLFEYFCVPDDNKEKFCSIEQVKDSLTLEACVKRIDEKRTVKAGKR